MTEKTERVKGDRVVDRVELSRYLNIDADHLSVYVRAGMPKLHHGRYGLISCLSRAIRHQQDALKRRGFRIGDVTERDVRIRALKAAADLKELELARQRRELIPAPDVERRWLSIVSVTKARILALPVRIAPRVVGEWIGRKSRS